MTTRQRRQQRQKLYWKDGLQALQQTEAQRATHQRMWQRMFVQAQTDLQTEEAVVFLGAENMDILRQANTQAGESPRRTRPPLPALLATAVALALSTAGYALSYYRVAARMR